MQLIDTDHRRYGGQLAHLGVMIMVIGVAGSSLYDSEELFQLAPGESTDVRGGRYVLTYHGLEEVPGPNFTAVQANVSITHPDGTVRDMTPSRRFYRNWEEKPHTQIAVHMTLREDFYIALAGWEGGGKLTALKVKVNPLVNWLWIGSIIMGLGAIFCMLPRLIRTNRALPEATESRQRTFEPYSNGSSGASVTFAPPVSAPDREQPHRQPVHASSSEMEMIR